MKREGRLPDELVACVGGGSNAIGLFFEFLEDPGVRMTGVEAGGRGIRTGEHAARFAGGKLGVLQGCKTFILQNPDGQIELTVGQHAEVLATGDSASFAGDLPHGYANSGAAHAARFALTVFEPGVGPGSRSEATDV